MPYKSEKAGPIPPAKDKRRKLSEADRVRIRELYESPDWSQRRLAGEFGVSRRLVQFVLDEDKLARHNEAAAERRKDGRYYDADKHAEHMRTHRRHKNELYRQGLLGERAGG